MLSLKRIISIWLAILTVVGGLPLNLLPVMAQDAQPDPAPQANIARLVFTADKSALEIPFNTGEPTASTANLIALVTDDAGAPIEGATVTFSSGNAWFPDAHGQVSDYQAQTTNAEGVAFTTYAVSNQTIEDWVDLHATVVIDPAEPVESRQFLHRRLQIALNNVADSTNLAIDAAAAGEEAVQELAVDNEERLQQMADGVQGQNTIELEMDAVLDPTSNNGTSPASLATIAMQIRAVASRSVTSGGSTRPPNLGRTQLQFALSSSDEHTNPASLKHTQDNVFLNFQQTSLGSGEATGESITWAGTQSAANTLHLNNRAWGQRDLTITVRLVAQRPIDGDLLAQAGYNPLPDSPSDYLLAEEQFTFRQENPDRPELKLVVKANPTELAPTDRSLTLTGQLTADEASQWGLVEAQVKSSDGVGEEIDQGAKLTNQAGEFSYRYTPVRDGLERELSFTLTADAVEGANRIPIEGVESAQTTIVVKQTASITTQDDDLEQPAPDQKILLGEGAAGDHTIKIYGNQSQVVTSGFYEGFNLALDNTIRRGTTINDLGAISGYRNGPQSFMKLSIEVVTPEGSGALAAGNQLSGRVTGITGAETFRNFKSYLLAAESAPASYYFERPNTSRGQINVALDADGQAIYYFAPGQVELRADESKSVVVEFIYRGTPVRVTIPVIRQADLSDPAGGPTIELTPRILGQIPTAERDGWPPVVKESLAQADNQDEFLRSTWEVAATVDPPAGRQLDSTELLFKSSDPIRYLASNGGSVFDTTTEFVATLTPNRRVTAYLQLTEDEVAEFTIRHSLAGQIYEKTLRLAPGGEVNPPDEGEDDEDGGDDTDSPDDDSDGDEGSEGGEGSGAPVAVDNNLTDSTLGVKLSLTSEFSNIGIGEKIQIPVIVRVPSDVKLPESGPLLDPVAFHLKPYYLEGGPPEVGSEVVFVSMNQKTGRQTRRNLLVSSTDGPGINYAVYPQFKEFRLGYFELTKGNNEVDRVGVNLFYTFLRDINGKEVPKEIRSRGETFEFGFQVMEKKIGVDLRIGHDGDAPPVQPLPTESATGTGGGDDEPESSYSFDFINDKPLSSMTIDQAVDTAQAVFNASSGLSTSDKANATASFNQVRLARNIFNLNTFVPRLENVAERAFGEGEQNDLLLAVAHMVADICNVLARSGRYELSPSEQRFIDQAIAEIKRANYSAIDDLRGEANLRELGEVIADSFEEAGVYTKRPIAGNPLGLGTTFAGDDVPSSNAVGIFDILSLWFNSLFNRN